MREDRLKLGKMVWFYLPTIFTIVVDQVTKAMARGMLTDGPVTVIPGFFDIVLTFNRGAAFGILPDWAPLFIMVALVFIYVIVKFRKHWATSRGLSLGLGLLLGGAVGNLIDRLTSPTGAVTDFLSFYVNYRDDIHAWPTFNVADAAIVVGAVLVLIYVYIIERLKLERG